MCQSANVSKPSRDKSSLWNRSWWWWRLPRLAWGWSLRKSMWLLLLKVCGGGCCVGALLIEFVGSGACFGWVCGLCGLEAVGRNCVGAVLLGIIWWVWLLISVVLLDVVMVFCYCYESKLMNISFKFFIIKRRIRWRRRKQKRCTRKGWHFLARTCMPTAPRMPLLMLSHPLLIRLHFVVRMQSECYSVYSTFQFVIFLFRYQTWYLYYQSFLILIWLIIKVGTFYYYTFEIVFNSYMWIFRKHYKIKTNHLFI